MSLFSVACLLLRVEFARAEEREPEPGPQAQIYQNSDYYEAKQLLAKRRWTEAAVVLKAVLRRTPDFYPAAVGLANALAYQGRREEALSTLSQVIEKIKGRTPEASPTKYKQALISRSRVISKIFLTQESFQTYQDGYNFLVGAKYRQAREKFEKVLAKEPDNVLVLTRLGQSMVMESDFDSAAERLRVAKRLNPYEPEIDLWLGRSLHQRGETGEAVEELRTAQKSLRNVPQTAIWLADALDSMGQRGLATQLLEEDIKAQPFHVESLIALARMRMRSTTDQSKNLLMASKDLRIALSRISDTPSRPGVNEEDELGLEIEAPVARMKDEIKILLQQVDARLADTNRAGET